MATIELKNIAHTYEPTAADPYFALKGLDLTWKDGGTYALLGPSGCGKTTMLNIISGLLRPSQGGVFFDGADFTRLPPPKRNIAQVFQFPVIYTRMSVEENLAFPLICRKVPRKQRVKRVREVADLLNLSHKLKSPARHLAADEKQLISLGRGLVRNDVSALLMDEPLTVIDPQLKFQIRRKLKQINELYGLTMVYVTHDQTEAMTFADTIVVMTEGEVVQSGTPQELYNRPRTTYVGYFIGSPAMNFLSCKMRGDRLETGGGEVVLPEGVSVPADSKNLKIGIRPRYLRFIENEAPGSVRGRIQQVQESGEAKVVTVEVRDEKVKVKLPSGTDVPHGEVRLELPQDRVCVYADDVLLGEEGCAGPEGEK